ncbi:bZIP transcription factor 27-like [Silene latifolia]|uniref:bZIP transcription factor 27-like n=1 Tax=Silene latifolia TaxID=37657 RepID=UPI003D77C9F2
MHMEKLHNEVDIESEKDVLQSVNTPSFMASLNIPFEGLAFGASSVAAVVAPNSSPPRPMSFFGCFSNQNKRVSEHHDIVEDSCVDRRHKRMMKNRESAARSRSRRQAYTSELEREIAELLEENAKLRKQQLELVLSAPARIPKKNNHSRSLTAPF